LLFLGLKLRLFLVKRKEAKQLKQHSLSSWRTRRPQVGSGIWSRVLKIKI